MASETSHAVWVLPATRAEFSLFWKNQMIALGPRPLGDLRELPAEQESFRTHALTTFADVSINWLKQYADRCFNFAITVKLGDHIVVATANETCFLVGSIAGEYLFRPPELSPYEHARVVNRLDRVYEHRIGAEIASLFRSVNEFTNLKDNSRQIREAIERLYR